MPRLPLLLPERFAPCPWFPLGTDTRSARHALRALAKFIGVYCTTSNAREGLVRGSIRNSSDCWREGLITEFSYRIHGARIVITAVLDLRQAGNADESEFKPLFSEFVVIDFWFLSKRQENDDDGFWSSSTPDGYPKTRSFRSIQKSYPAKPA